MGTSSAGQYGSKALGYGFALAPAFAAAWLASGLAALPAMQAATASARRSDQQSGDEIERLRAMLAMPGADGAEARETAIERLLAMPSVTAHKALQQVLASGNDPDGVRAAILAALQRHLLANGNTRFGGASPEVRNAIVGGYAGVLARLWQKPESDAAAPPALRGLARTALQRVPARELEEALRPLLPAADADAKAALFACIADLQQVWLGQLLAEFIDDPDAAVRAAARQALRLLTFREDDFANRAQFTAWFAANGSMRYVDLAERAARRALARADRAELAQLRVETAVRVVSAYTTRAPGFDWAAIAAVTLVDDTAVLDACLLTLQKTLAAGLPPDSPGGARVAFCRALLQRWRQTPVEHAARRALLLEVAAYTARPEETELVAELVALLTAGLDAPAVEEQAASLRGLRCFPTADNRACVLRHATAQLARGADAKPLLAAALATLGARTAPRWTAPSPSDADKAEWLELVRGVCATPGLEELREAALALAATLDPKDQRVPEVFAVLLDFAKDGAHDVKFRSACLIQLRAWRDQPGAADRWVQLMHALLGDAVPELRQLAAESLPMLTESVDLRKREWISATIVALRDRLAVEPSDRALRAMVESLQVCGREPQMPEQAIGALNTVLLSLGPTVAPEHQFRLDPLLTALATLAADPAAAGGQWLGACAQLLQFGRRDSLRLVLQNHQAIELARDVAAADAGRAERARSAMHVLIKTAAMKPADKPWKSTEELQREALDVRVAFNALDDAADPAQRLDEPPFRVLRLEVELAAARYQDVVQRAARWLAPTPAPVPGGAAPVEATAVQKDRMRALAAEAWLELGKPDAAAKLLRERESENHVDARLLELQSRIGKALFDTDKAGAVELLEKVVKATPPEDGAFRARLVAWAVHRVRQDPSARAAVWADVEAHRALFDAAECPAELREAFLGLRAQ